MVLSKPKSISHEHLLSIINTESRRFTDDYAVRILEVGCGNGDLVSYLFQNLPMLNSRLTYDIFGFDVADHCIDSKLVFPDSIIKQLEKRFSGVPWKERIGKVTVNDKWPYPDKYFDVIISNQVCEHVDNPNLFFSEINRVMRYGGFSVHLFPLKHCLYEGHLFLPFVHRIMNYDLLKYYITIMSRIGIGWYKTKKRKGVSIDEYAENKAQYLCYFTNYLSHKQLLNLAKANKLLISFKYTREFYSKKIRAIFKLNRSYEYKTKRSIFADYLSFLILIYISSITVFLENKRQKP